MLKVVLLYFSFDDYTTELANALVNYVDLTLIKQERKSQFHCKALDPKIRVFSLKKPAMRDPRNLTFMNQVVHLIRDIKPDILHVQECNDFWYFLIQIWEKFPPLVTTIHDVFHHQGDRTHVFGSRYTRSIAFYRSRQLIVHANTLKQALTDKFNVSKEKINIVPHGELGSLYKRVSFAPSPPREPHTLLFFGRIWPYKGLKYLLEAMPLVIERVPEVKLIIAGRGEDIGHYFNGDVDQKRYEVINSYIDNEDLVKLFHRAAVTVLPYTEASQSGVVALSYGMGTPVIASAVGGLSEVVHHEEDGLLVPPRNHKALAETIISLLKSFSLQERLQQGVLSRVHNDLNWSNIARQTVNIYEKAI